MAFRWSEEKNRVLKIQRGVSFERIVTAIEEGGLVDVLEHPNPDRYGDQLILVVKVAEYAYCVPCVPEADGSFFLKTLYPSRKYTRLHGFGGAI